MIGSNFSLLASTERRLHNLGQLEDHPNEVQYFWPGLPVGPIQDDHIPFLQRGKALSPHHLSFCLKWEISGIMFFFQVNLSFEWSISVLT